MNLFNNIEKIIFDSPKWKLLLFLFVILIFKTGIFYHPNLWRHLEVAKSPFENYFENTPYLLEPGIVPAAIPGEKIKIFSSDKGSIPGFNKLNKKYVDKPFPLNQVLQMLLEIFFVLTLLLSRFISK